MMIESGSTSNELRGSLPAAHEVAPRSDHEAKALRFFTSLLEKDMEAFAALWHVDAVVRCPFRANALGIDVPEALIGKAEIVEKFARNVEHRKEHQFWISGVHRTVEGNVIIEAEARSIIGETGAVYEQQYVFVFAFQDDLFFRVGEYTNPINIAIALTPFYGNGFHEQGGLARAGRP